MKRKIANPTAFLLGRETRPSPSRILDHHLAVRQHLRTKNLPVTPDHVGRTVSTVKRLRKWKLPHFRPEPCHHLERQQVRRMGTSTPILDDGHNSPKKADLVAGRFSQHHLNICSKPNLARRSLHRVEPVINRFKFKKKKKMKPKNRRTKPANMCRGLSATTARMGPKSAKPRTPAGEESAPSTPQVAASRFKDA